MDEYDRYAPCPFCGVVETDHDDGDPLIHLDEDNGNGFLVRCEICLCRGPLNESSDHAVQLWNSRNEGEETSNG